MPLQCLLVIGINYDFWDRVHGLGRKNWTFCAWIELWMSRTRLSGSGISYGKNSFLVRNLRI